MKNLKVSTLEGNAVGVTMAHNKKKIARYTVRNGGLVTLKPGKKPTISKETIWQAIRWELSETELDRILSFEVRYEKDDYYRLDLIIEKMQAAMRGEKSISYFNRWCIVLLRCFMNFMTCRSKKLSRLFYQLGEFFDGASFTDPALIGEGKRKAFMEMIAYVKFYDHQIQDCKDATVSDFVTNGIITYVSFGFSLRDGEESLYQFCVVDTIKRPSIIGMSTDSSTGKR